MPQNVMRVAGKAAVDPGQRIKDHAEKTRKRIERQAGTPGPGAYSPARPASTVAGGSRGTSAGFSASFASKSKRSDFTKEQLFSGDPGSYDPQAYSTLASSSKKSVSKSNRSGAGSFGGKEQRALAIDIMGESTPGPGAYDGGKMMRTGKLGALSAMDTGERMPMSSFKSKSLQRPRKKETENVPGAGAYSPQFTALEKGKTNPGASMRAKGARFQGANSWEKAQAAEPGPGSYEIEILRSGYKSSLSGMSQSTHSKGALDGSIAFGTEAVRELPWEN